MSLQKTGVIVRSLWTTPLWSTNELSWGNERKARVFFDKDDVAIVVAFSPGHMTSDGLVCTSSCLILTSREGVLGWITKGSLEEIDHDG